jgi:hypothetical protein
MESALIVITLVSLAMTIVLGAILARVMREERRRSAARVAVLREMADTAARQQSVEAVETRVESPVTMADDLLLARTDDLHLHAPADLFVRPEPGSAWPRRLAIAATIVLLVTVSAIALRSRSTPAVTGDRVQARAAAAQTAGLLELLSLKQSQEASALTITGLVQNPRDGAVLSKVSATALLFGPDGTLLASGRAALDFTVLRPGDESAFVISVPVTAPVARYRVGFRSEDGRVIGHIDRRAAATMADRRLAVSVAARGPS